MPNAQWPVSLYALPLPPPGPLGSQKVLQELKCIAGNLRHKARFAAQGGLALLNEAMPCHTRCRVQR